MKSIIYSIIFIITGTLGSFAQSLEDYYKIAAENNPGLQAKYKDYEAALQKIPQVNTMPDPTFSFGYFISPVETRVGPQRVKFSLTQMFPWFGTLRAQGDAAAFIADAKFQAFLDSRNKLFYQVAAAYYPLYELNQQIRIQKANVDILLSFKNITQSKYSNGNSPMVDVLRVDIMLQDAQTDITILRDKEKSLLTTFNRLLDRDEALAVSLPDSMESNLLPENFRKDSLLINNPALNTLDLKVSASEAAEVAARKQGLPKLGAGLDYVIVGKGPLNAIDNGKDVLMPMLTVSIPIFRKKYNASVKETQLYKEEYILQKREMTNDLSSDYEMTMFELEQEQQLLTLYSRQVQTTQQSMNLLFTAYGNSGKDFVEVLRMQQELLKYEKLKASAEAKYYVALAKLNYLTAKTY